MASSNIHGDFLLNAPVVLDILQPNVGRLQRVLTRIVGIDKNTSHVAVENNSKSAFSPGSVFPIFIKQRNISPDDWIIVNLEVIDDDSEDGGIKSPNTFQMYQSLVKMERRQVAQI
jgi:hypothetical protein